MGDNKILALAKKLHELAKRGIDGEKQNALDMLEKMMQKHGITWDMLDVNNRKEREFKIHKDQHKFLVQIIHSVAGSVDIYGFASDKKRTTKRVVVDITDMEFIEVTAKFEFYWAKYKEDMELFYSAFIQKNKLFRKQTEEDEEKDLPPLTAEEKAKLYRMRQMMDGLDRHTMQLRLTDKR